MLLQVIVENWMSKYPNRTVTSMKYAPRISTHANTYDLYYYKASLTYQFFLEFLNVKLE